MSRFDNKHVFITGGAGGIGELMGRHALEQGAAKLIIWDINKSNLRSAANNFEEYSDKIHTYSVDVSDPEQIYDNAETVLKQHGHIDILINNAGIVVGKRFEKYSRDEINKTIAVNLLGAMHTTRSVLPTMMDRGTGHIVNIASAAGYMGNPKMSVYASSKWGVIGWSESLRIELKQYPRIRVTSIEPGYINTGMFAGVKPPVLTPFLEPEDIARQIIKAVQKNKLHLRAPFMVKLLPFLKGILPTRLFDFVAGKLFQVYHSMDTFQGRTSETEQQ